MVTPPLAGAISPSEALREHGVRTHHNRFESGEVRFRLMSSDGNGYILTRASHDGWQNSHVHYRTQETYIVEAGWMVLAVEGPRGVETSWLGPGDIVTTPIGQVHNVYLPAAAIIHTVKHGARGGDQDRTPVPRFDEVLASLGPSLIEASRRP
ncbi:hypothetical protein [Brevundimonas fluminis]|uniref:hypothetical protein n=1 Tax=Brevundimonas fluminis TaxID=2487274 RepID=UPI000F65808A|nr:hypothetical protein [Brevundimonas fluminis]